MNLNQLKQEYKKIRHLLSDQEIDTLIDRAYQMGVDVVQNQATDALKEARASQREEIAKMVENMPGDYGTTKDYEYYVTPSLDDIAQAIRGKKL